MELALSSAKGKTLKGRQVAYENYLLRNGATWDLMTEKQKSQMLTNAHSAGNKAIREAYAMDNGIMLR